MNPEDTMKLTADAQWINTPVEAIRHLAVVCAVQQALIIDLMQNMVRLGVMPDVAQMLHVKTNKLLIDAVDAWLQREFNVQSAAMGLLEPTLDDSGDL